MSGRISVSFESLKTNYPFYNRLPKNLQDYIDVLNGITPEQKKAGIHPKGINTPCCLQVSHALNSVKEFIPPHSFRRANPSLGGQYYLQAVDELEVYLSGRYGRGENIRRVAATKKLRNPDEMKAYIKGKQGILLFRNNGAGQHTEIWDTDTTLQNGQVPGVYVGPKVFENERVLFWEVSAPGVGVNPVPEWLQGWWSVFDGVQYYYYFSNQHIVTYTKTKPKYLSEPPQKTPLNEGEVTISSLPNRSFSIVWGEADGGTTKETFVPLGTDKMNGASNRYAPLTAEKMTGK